MMNNNEEKILKRAINIYGKQAQLEMFYEEVGELLQAINKQKRNPSHQNWDNLCEEIADVGIMLDQLVLIFDSQHLMRVNHHRAKKLDKMDCKLKEKENLSAVNP